MYLKWSQVDKSLIYIFLLFISCLIPCVDINECAQDGLHNCRPDTSICENIPGSFLCNCKVGFTNDETQCESKLNKH